ncbi:MAG: hypothetical protein AB1451_09675 [Nitrospirota bacterium]
MVQCAVPIPPFTPTPATGDAFVGRQGLVKNLRWRLARGESLAVIGGPKLGKTSLVRTALQGLPHHHVIEMDLAAEPSREVEFVSGAIVVLDNLDALPDSTTVSLLARVWTANPAALMVTGGRRLRALLGDSGTLAGASFRVVPLSVLLDGETRRLIGPHGDPSLAAWTGNHPYLTKLLLHYGNNAIANGRGEWEPFVRSLLAEIHLGPELRLFRYLIERGKPVNPAEAQADTAIANIKSVADTLVYLGAISRWIRDEEATLFAGCRLLNNALRSSA